MENVNGSLLASEAMGVKVYCWPVVKIVNGVPLITGATLVAASASVVTSAANDVQVKTRKINSRFNCCINLPIWIRK